jgi:hypothetical protein
MKEGSLFCFVVMRSTKPVYVRLYSWCFWKALDEEGCMGLFLWRLNLRCKSSWYWTISSLKTKLNRSWNIQRNWNVPLVLLERSWWAGFDGTYLVRFGSKMWEILSFKWFLLLKIQINSKNQVLEGKISWEHGNTWRLTIQFKHDFLSYLAVQKINTYIAKQCSHVEFPYFVMGSHLRQRHRPY